MVVVEDQVKVVAENIFRGFEGTVVGIDEGTDRVEVEVENNGLVFMYRGKQKDVAGLVEKVEELV